jgi:phage gp29-like protein
LSQILRAADEGALDAAMQLFEQMEEKDAHLFSVANTRRLALTGLDWQVVSAADMTDGVDRALADEAADYCRCELSRLEDFDEALQHLALALGRNIALAELVWESDGGGHRIADIVPVDFGRITFDRLERPRVLIGDDMYEGRELPDNKFVVHCPHSASGHPSRGGLLRVTALAFLGKHYAMKDWLVFAEVFGMPVRIARYEPAATAEEKRELLSMLQRLGSDAAGIFSKAVELEIVGTSQGGEAGPYKILCEFFNREISKAWLGQTLTTDTAGSTGTFAAAQVHERVREDLREDDIRKEGRTVRRDILRPLSQFKFGLDVPVPYFRRKLEQPRDLRELADVLAAAVNNLGIKVPRRWAHEMLGIPEPAGSESVLDREVAAP